MHLRLPVVGLTRIWSSGQHAVAALATDSLSLMGQGALRVCSEMSQSPEIALPQVVPSRSNAGAEPDDEVFHFGLAEVLAGGVVARVATAVCTRPLSRFILEDADDLLPSVVEALEIRAQLAEQLEELHALDVQAVFGVSRSPAG